MTSPTLSELVRLQEKASTATKPGRFLEIGEEYEAYHRFIAAARNFDLRAIATQYEAMRELLKVAKCPNCDGSGTVIYTQDDDGHYKDIGPCQWCDERNKVTNEKT